MPLVKKYSWDILRQIDLQKMPIWAKKKIIFSDQAYFDLGRYVNKQNCNIWGTENPHARIHWKAKTSRCLLGILVQRHNWGIFPRKLERRGRYSQWRMRRCQFWQKKHLFRWNSFWSWRVWKQAKLSHLGHRKADAPKTSHFLVRILVQRHN